MSALAATSATASTATARSAACWVSTSAVPANRWRAVAGTSPAARCRPPVTVVKRYPLARSCVMMAGSAATVCARSPPPSWNMMIAPRRPRGMAAATMRATPGRRPVRGVEAGEHHEVAVPARPLGRLPVRRGQRVRLGGIRHPQQARADAGRAGQRVLGEGELEVLPPSRRGEVGVRVGVRADFVAVAQLLPHQPRVAGHVRAHQEERPGYPVMPQDRQYLRRPRRVRAVVEGQGHGPGRHRVAAGA